MVNEVWPWESVGADESDGKSVLIKVRDRVCITLSLNTNVNSLLSFEPRPYSVIQSQQCMIPVTVWRVESYPCGLQTYL